MRIGVDVMSFAVHKKERDGISDEKYHVEIGNVLDR